MRTIPTTLLLTLLAAPLVARVSMQSPYTHIQLRQPTEDSIAACLGIHRDWLSRTCSEDDVARGICASSDDGETWPTVECTQARVQSDRCSEADLGRQIPDATACSIVLDDWIKGALRDLATAGLQRLDEQDLVDREPGPVEDGQ